MDYHSVDSGDLMTGRPYGYTEEYQSYEQTGTTTTYPSNASDCNDCPSLVDRGIDYRELYCAYSNEYKGMMFRRPWPCSYPTTKPTYGYVTRTRLVTYDKESGLFSLGIGVPYASYNAGLYSTQGMRIIIPMLK